MDLEGRQLLDEWSNLNEFRALNDLVRAHEKEAVALDMQLQQARGGSMAWDKERRAEIGQKQTQNQAQILDISRQIAAVHAGHQSRASGRYEAHRRQGRRSRQVRRSGQRQTDQGDERKQNLQDVLRELNVPDDAYMRPEVKSTLYDHSGCWTRPASGIYFPPRARNSTMPRAASRARTVASTEGKLQGHATNRDDLEKLRKEGPNRPKRRCKTAPWWRRNSATCRPASVPRPC